MKLNSNYYIHNSDRKALQALKALPGFTQFFKAFMKVWSEKQFQILNMSTNLRINDKQLSKYYDMLPPICEKLGIDVPELYMELDVCPNAYTAGDTNPFIVITSGLIETMPEELIPTVLAHECGHIACHHSLYSTMGRIIINEVIDYLGLNDLAIFPIKVAFSYWMRCSELSADRAASICDGYSDKVVEMCMRFSGYDKDINDDANIDEFMKQANEYTEMVTDSKWNKTLEFLLLSQADHPLNAVRAKECAEWTKSERFEKLVSYINCSNDTDSFEQYSNEIPMPENSRYYIGRNYEDVIIELEKLGFNNIIKSKKTQKSLLVKNGQVLDIKINDLNNFDICDWIPIDSKITIEFYEPETEEEIATAHPGQIRTPDSTKRFIGQNFNDVFLSFKDSGFSDVETIEQFRDRKTIFNKEGSTTQVSINGQTKFSKGEWFDKKSKVLIEYITYIRDKE